MGIRRRGDREERGRWKSSDVSLMMAMTVTTMMTKMSEEEDEEDRSRQQQLHREELL